MKQYAYALGSYITSAGVSLRGVKQSASRAGSTEIGYISTINNMYIKTHIKENGKWIEC